MTTPTEATVYKTCAAKQNLEVHGPFTATNAAIFKGTLCGWNLTTKLVAACSDDAGANAFCGIAADDYPAGATNVITHSGITVELPSESSVNDGDNFRPAYAHDGGSATEVATRGPQIGRFVSARVDGKNYVRIEVGLALST